MSGENVDAVRQALAVFERDGLDRWLEHIVAPDAVYTQNTSVGPDAQTQVGWDGWTEAVTGWAEAFDEWGVDFHEALDAGDDRVVVTWTDRGRGKRSGAIVQRPMGAFVHTLHAGKIIHTVQYGRAEDALEAVGLRE